MINRKSFINSFKVLAIILALFTSCTEEEDASYNIMFEIIDRNHDPIEGANVSIDEIVLPLTDVYGRTSIELKSSKYSYSITADNFDPIEDDFNVYEHEDMFRIELTYESFKVSFNSDEGSAISSQTISYGDKASIPDEPIKEGLSFATWFLGDSEYDFSTPITSDIELTTRWGYAVLFRDGKTKTRKVAQLPVKFVDELPTASAEYCTFDCWTTYSKELGFIPFTNTTEVLYDSLVVYAKWKVEDVEGNEYPAIKIGYHFWMLENLKATKYNDNTEIPLVEYATDWENLTTPGYCYYNNEAGNKDTYGNLYNFYTVETKKLCPTGWIVANASDMSDLEMYVGMPFDVIFNGEWWYRGTNEGSKLAGSPELWTDGALKQDPEFAASFFNGIPAGLRGEDGHFEGIGEKAIWWYTSGNTSYIYYRSLSYDDSRPYSRMYFPSQKEIGQTVRCVAEKRYFD